MAEREVGRLALPLLTRACHDLPLSPLTPCLPTLLLARLCAGFNPNARLSNLVTMFTDRLTLKVGAPVDLYNSASRPAGQQPASALMPS